VALVLAFKKKNLGCWGGGGGGNDSLMQLLYCRKSEWNTILKEAHRGMAPLPKLLHS
jgi:hypothetical protein